jgi:hypothetical protein
VSDDVCKRLLHRVHDLRLDRIDVGSEVVDEVILGQPREALGVDAEVRQRRGRRTLEQRTDGLALVEPEGRDVNQTDDVRRIGAERGDDLTAVRMAGEDRGTVLSTNRLAWRVAEVETRARARVPA